MRILLLLSVLFLIRQTPYAQEAKDPPVNFSTTLSYTRTGGNSDTHSVGWNGEIGYTCSIIEVSGGCGYIIAPAEDRRNSESISVNGGVDIYFIPDRLYGHYGVKWERRTFAGLEHRLSNLGAVGVVILNNDSYSWNAKTGAKYVYEVYPEDHGSTPDEDKFTTIHVSTAYALTPKDYFEFELDLSYDANLEETDDQILGCGVEVNVTLTPWLGFNVGETFTFDNIPVSGFEKSDYTTDIGLTLDN